MNTGFDVNFNLSDRVDLLITLLLVYFSVNVYSYFQLRNLAATTRVYSTVHATTAVGLSLMYMYTGYGTVYLIMIYNSLAYCVYDSLVLLLGCKVLTIEPMMPLHHIAFMFGLVYFYKWYDYHISIALLMETSNIPLNLSWYMFKQNMTEGYRFTAVVMSLLATYFVCRILLLVYLIHQSWYNLECYSCVLFLSLLLVLNTVWFQKLVKKAFSVKVKGTK